MDFSNLKYNFTDKSKKTAVIESFPVLAEFKEFSNIHDDQLLRIAILSHQQGSPFVKLEREDYTRRLQRVFDYLEVKNEKLLNDLHVGANIKFEDMVTRLFIMDDSLAYSMWADKIRIFHYIGISLRQAPDLSNMVADMDKRSKLEKQRKDIYNDILDYETLVFPDSPTRKKIREKLTKLIQPAEQYALQKQVV